MKNYSLSLYNRKIIDMNNNITKFLKVLLEIGFSPKKISQLVDNEKEPMPVLRKCLCTQLVTQGDCKLHDVVKQIQSDRF